MRCFFWTWKCFFHYANLNSKSEKKKFFDFLFWRGHWTLSFSILLFIVAMFQIELFQIHCLKVTLRYNKTFDFSSRSIRRSSKCDFLLVAHAFIQAKLSRYHANRNYHARPMCCKQEAKNSELIAIKALIVSRVHFTFP